MEAKLARLKGILAGLGPLAVAYSGGTDSTFLLKVAHEVLGDGVIGLTADSPTQPRADLDAARTMAAEMGVRHFVLPTDELRDPRYAANAPDRCYVCKGHILDALLACAAAQGHTQLVDGSNADDQGDYRPGSRAAAERGVRSPLQEAGLRKHEVRALARAYGLPNWDKPSSACLASRIPYGTPVTVPVLAQIERSETFLRRKGFRQVRVRYHGTLARVEVEAGELPRALALREEIISTLREAGFTYVTLDLQGFRSGSLNEVTKNE